MLVKNNNFEQYKNSVVINEKEIESFKETFSLRLEEVKTYINETNKKLNILLSLKNNEDIQNDKYVILKSNKILSKRSIIVDLCKDFNKLIDNANLPNDIEVNAYIVFKLIKIENKPVVNCRQMQLITTLSYSIIDYGICLEDTNYLSIKNNFSKLNISNVLKSRLPNDDRIFTGKIMKDIDYLFTTDGPVKKIFSWHDNYVGWYANNDCQFGFYNDEIIYNLDIILKAYILRILKDKNKVLKSLFVNNSNIYINTVLKVLEKIVEIKKIEKVLNKEDIVDTVIKDFYISLETDGLVLYPKSGYNLYKDQTTKKLTMEELEKLSSYKLDYPRFLSFYSSQERSIVLKTKPRYELFKIDLTSQLQVISKASIFLLKSDYYKINIDRRDLLKTVITIDGFYSNTNDKILINNLLSLMFKDMNFYSELFNNYTRLEDIEIVSVTAEDLEDYKDLTSFKLKLVIKSKEYFSIDSNKVNLDIKYRFLENEKDIRKQNQVVFGKHLIFLNRVSG